MTVFKIIWSDFSFILFQFLVMLIQSKQDREPLSDHALVCLCQTGHTPCSCKPLPNKTRNLSLLPEHTVSARQGPLLGQLAQ